MTTEEKKAATGLAVWALLLGFSGGYLAAQVTIGQYSQAAVSLLCILLLAWARNLISRIVTVLPDSFFQPKGVKA